MNLRRQLEYVFDLGRYFGWVTTIKLMLSRLRGGSSVCKLQIHGAPHPISIRVGKTSDLWVVWQCYIRRSGSQTRAFDWLKDPQWVVDCGANIGCVSLNLLNRFPKVHLIAIEPDPGNFGILQDNLGPYGDRVRLVNAAVLGRCGTVDITESSDDGREWARRVVSSTEGSIKAIDLEVVLSMCGGTIDLLKVDIEGSELSVFSEDPHRWLFHVRNIAIELHGEECDRAFFGALHSSMYEQDASGELVLIKNLRGITEKSV